MTMPHGHNDDPTTRMERAAARLFLFVGAGLLFVAVLSAVSTGVFLYRSTNASGSVIAIVDHRDADGDLTWRPRVAFETAQGQRVEFESRHGSNRLLYQVDDLVEVVYDPDEPTHAEIAGALNVWSVTIVSFLVGTAFVGICFAINSRSKGYGVGQNDPSEPAAST